MTRGARCLIAATLALAAAPAVAGPNPVYTPVPGSAERTAIVKTLHGGDDDPQLRFTFKQFRVVHDGQRAIAYVEGDGAVGGFQSILTRDGKAAWRNVWGEGDGGSNSCVVGARHYAWAVRLITSYHVAPDALFPGIAARARELKRMAKTDPELQCVGDLDGGER
ncbi:hypothetical protein [Sphingomonas sp. ERG5]|uniref:hypothetical protein n=1 Tax=Sphingomonas sp. ERG5 TaxID=1381597 RepID=UPI00054C7E74|nr:hypothetical protein [Sphingomonas sp. ERG5]